MSPFNPTPLVKIQEQLSMKRVEQSITYDNKMYRVGIPWREDRPNLPDNYNMALRRLQNVEKKLQRSPDIALANNEIIGQYVAKGYVRKVPENEHSNSKWYLPHFPVLRPDKDTTKTRIVFDASARCEGIALNDPIQYKMSYLFRHSLAYCYIGNELIKNGFCLIGFYLGWDNIHTEEQGDVLRRKTALT